ncbi:hypothetical protein NLJ89_g11972 [Agrocybe chaxingu]|uniref:Uncharacterized protein n=1 Tax=Agrocybe chaxingu TaxID=84603 RepID=A0A9W8JN77_9AGAR|nr:hypothetical protein NLJ89_g11972 [Agrocybe chaxingu]
MAHLLKTASWGASTDIQKEQICDKPQVWRLDLWKSGWMAKWPRYGPDSLVNDDDDDLTEICQPALTISTADDIGNCLNYTASTFANLSRHHGRHGSPVKSHRRLMGASLSYYWDWLKTSGSPAPEAHVEYD